MTITIIISNPAAPPPPTTGLRITSFPLPALGTSAPYSSNGSSKHTNMASDGVRLYVTGGDWTHSATDGTWSMSLADGSWRKDHAGPVVPTTPAPHALQDGAGFEWVASKGKFLIWPGSYITFGQGQSATLFLRLGMGIGEEGQGSPGEGSPVEPPPEPEVVVWGQGYRFIFPPSNRARILRDDDDIVALILAMLQSGTLH